MDDPCFVDGGVLVVALLVAVPPVPHRELVQQQLKLEERGLTFWRSILPFKNEQYYNYYIIFHQLHIMQSIIKFQQQLTSLLQAAVDCAAVDCGAEMRMVELFNLHYLETAA